MKEDEIANNAASRRNFLKGAGMTGLGLAGATLIGSSFGAGVQKANAAVVTDGSYNDADIVNFALNLEYLEAEFYSMATYGATLVQRGILTKADETGPTTGGRKVNGWNTKTPPTAYLATALREDEMKHVLFLRSVLGSGAVKKPAINLDAVGFGFADVGSFLMLARIFEDVGVSAYLGAAPLISSKVYLGAAAAILATEAQHAGSIRVYCIIKGVKSPKVDSKDIPPTPSNVYDVDSNALSIPRTTAEVLRIVYGGGKCSGGFYPDGMNGYITCA